MRPQALWKATAAIGGVILGGTICFQKNGRVETATTPGPGVEEIMQRLRPGYTWDSNWDKRDPEYRFLSRYRHRGMSKLKAVSHTDLDKFDEVRPKVRRNIFLIRHGQYCYSASSANDRKLTSLGRQQAEATGKRLKSLLNRYPGIVFDRYIVSGMIRAKETAEIIGRELNLIPNPLNSFKSDPLLNEGGPIQPDPPSRWHPEFTYHQDGMRIESAFRKYFHRADPRQERDSYEIIVCHANVIRYFCCRALQFRPETWLRMSLGNGSITHIRIDPDGDVTLCSLGDNSHMSKELLTTK